MLIFQKMYVIKGNISQGKFSYSDKKDMITKDNTLLDRRQDLVLGRRGGQNYRIYITGPINKAGKWMVE